MKWYYILLIILGCLLILFILSFIKPLYKHFFKRFWDFLLSLIAIIVLLPFFIIFTPINAIAMKGNPFFVQKRPGKNCKIFKLIKYKTMTNKKDKNGNLLPDAERLTKYGKWVRSTSIDELPELLNILCGTLSIVGPRPLLVKYLPLYTDEQNKRHMVSPGLTGWAQVNGRNAISWDEKFILDVQYVEKVSLLTDIKILFMTVSKVIKHNGISEQGKVTIDEFKGENNDFNY